MQVPLFPLNTVLFPGGPLPLRIFEPRYVEMVRDLRDGAVVRLDPETVRWGLFVPCLLVGAAGVYSFLSCLCWDLICWYLYSCWLRDQ